MTYTRSVDFVEAGSARRSEKLNHELDLIAAAFGEVDLTAVLAAIALKANIASPTFTGTPAAPTPAVTDDSTKLATTAFVIDVIGASAVALPPQAGHANEWLTTNGTNASWGPNVSAVTWASITSKPTTRSGFGLTDANALMTVRESGVTDVTDPTFLNFIGATVTANSTGADIDIAAAVSGTVPHFLLLAQGII